MGTVLIVGAGNSALELCTALLKYRENENEIQNERENENVKEEDVVRVMNTVRDKYRQIDQYKVTEQRERERVESFLENGNIVEGNEETSSFFIRNQDKNSQLKNENKNITKNINNYKNENININNDRNKRKSIHMSVRSIPPCIPRQWGPLSVEEMSVWFLQYLPVRIADSVVWLFYRILLTGRYKYRNRIPGRKFNPDWYPFSSRRVPPIDKGNFTTAVAEGKIILHSCVDRAVGKKLFFKNIDSSLSSPCISSFLPFSSSFFSSSSSAAASSTTTTFSSSPLFHSIGKNNKDNLTVAKEVEVETEEIDSLYADIVVLCTGYEADWSWLEIPLSLPLSLPFSLSLLSPSLPSPSLTQSLSLCLQSDSPFPSPASGISSCSHDKSLHTTSIQHTDRKTLISAIAKQRSAAPHLSLCDGVFFIGYDPGNALVPLSAIRSQARDIAIFVKQIIHANHSKH